MESREPTDKRLEQALALLRSLVSQESQTLSPWYERELSVPPTQGRLSATDRLSWWFRPMTGSGNPWDDYFDPGVMSPQKTGSTGLEQITWPFVGEDPVTKTPFNPPAAQEPPGSWATLRMILAEPEEELVDEDGEAVVTRLYDFLHAIGRRDADLAMTFVAPDFHMMEDDQEIDRLGLHHQILALLDSLQGWEFDISLVEVPQPVLHPEAILIYAEIQIDAIRPDDESRKTILERRIAVFTRQPKGDWLISALSPV